MVNKIVILLCVFSLMSCQDNKSKDKKAVNSEKTSSNKNKEKSIFDEVNQSEYGIDTITRVKQTELKPFLKAYGQKNLETRVLVSTEFGDIEIELFRDTPMHRANFIRLTKLGYFNTSYFYRIEPGFVIQAGNSDNRITGRLRKTIGDFLIPKEFHDKYKNNYGMVGAAKYTKQNVSKASSPFEFYIIVDKDGSPHLDKEHTVFGRVVKGMDVAEKISKLDRDSDSSWPVENIEIEVKVLK